MKRKSTLLTLLTLVALLAVPAAALAQGAFGQTWTSTIYYYNPVAEDGQLQVTYYNTVDGSELPSGAIPVKGHQAGEVYIGDTGVTQDFLGSAVLSASVPVLAVYEQTASGTDPNYGRMLYTAFDYDQAADKIYVPSFVIDPKSYKSQVGVQVVDGPAELKITLYDALGVFAGEMTQSGVAAGQTFIFDEVTIRDNAAAFRPDILTKPFNGSAVIEITGGTAVAAVEEFQTNGRRAYAFEGVSQVGTKVYVPTANCRYSTGAQTTFLTIQNAGTAETTVKLSAFKEITTNTTTQTALKRNYVVPGLPIQPGAKVTVSTCALGTPVSARSTSMVIESSNGQPLAVVGKVTATSGLSSAFVGQVAAEVAGDASRVVLPYVNWATNQYKGYRTTITVMNASGELIPLNDVEVTFYDRVAAPKTYKLGPIPADSKRSFTPSSAKALKPDLSFKGAVEVKSSSGKDLIVIVRLEKRVSGVTGYTVFGEDYLGIPYIAAP